jgi:hypothetical protein
MKISNLIATLCVIIVLSSCANFGSYNQIDSQVSPREDGGYTLTLKGQTQIVQPVTAEGFFPKQSIYSQIQLIGLGKNWEYRNQHGFYYQYPKDIECKNSYWDIGYAWVDEKRENIYLNFYWIDSPNSLKESKVNGKYKIRN